MHLQLQLDLPPGACACTCHKYDEFIYIWIYDEYDEFIYIYIYIYGYIDMDTCAHTSASLSCQRARSTLECWVSSWPQDTFIVFFVLSFILPSSDSNLKHCVGSYMCIVCKHTYVHKFMCMYIQLWAHMYICNEQTFVFFIYTYICLFLYA